MFERFTERARQVTTLAQEEARTLKQEIGSEHILLGLIREEDGLAAQILRDMDITAVKVRARIGKASTVSDSQVTPFSQDGKKVLELALREALSLGHNYIGTEHVLLGIVRADESFAAKIMAGLGHSSEDIRNAIISRLSNPRRERVGDPLSDPTDDRIQALADIESAIKRVDRSVRAFLREWNGPEIR